MDDSATFGHSVNSNLNKDVKGKTHTYYQVTKGNQAIHKLAFLAISLSAACKNYYLEGECYNINK